MEKKRNSKINKDLLKKLIGRPENHILKKTNKQIEGIMGKISYLANYTQLLMAYQIKNQLKVHEHCRSSLTFPLSMKGLSNYEKTSL